MVFVAHAGGADEILLVLVPFLVFMIVYRLVRGPIPTEQTRPPEGRR